MKYSVQMEANGTILKVIVWHPMAKLRVTAVLFAAVPIPRFASSTILNCLFCLHVDFLLKQGTAFNFVFIQ